MNEELFEKLQDMGAEIEDTLERLMGDEELYLKYLRKLHENEDIDVLRSAVAENDSQKAENAVHTLKGMALNLGLLPLVDVCMDILLEFREGKVEEACKMLPDVEREFEKWTSAIAEG